MIIVSACLAGLNTRYDGKNRIDGRIVALVEQHKAIPLCPEQLGGLPTPRARSGIQQGDGRQVLAGESIVLTEHGGDVTLSFIRGAYETLNLAELMKITEFIFKEGSPSCGVNYIIRNTKRVKGMGVTSALLTEKGFKITSI